VSILAVLLFVLTERAQSQSVKGPGVISGRIIDSLSGQPVEYATISLNNLADNKVVNGTTSDDKGFFKLNDIAEGNYKMLIYFMGYKTSEKNNLVISKTSPVISAGTIYLVSTQTKLKEAVVVAEKELIENRIDKTVYNVEKDVTSQGGVATDALQKIPQVSVDVDGNVELQGNSNIRFLINGKPSSIFGNNIADVLKTIPSSQIQSIEVITSPGAKYDAEGTGGIINIILKKSTIQGINGNVSVSAGTRLENGSFNLNARKGKFGVNAFVSGNAQLTSVTNTSMNRLTQDPAAGQSSTLNQNGQSNFDRNGYQTGFGFDWGITEKDNIIGSLSYNHYGNNSIGVTNQQSILQDASGNTLSNVGNIINATNTFNSYALDWNLNYKKEFSKKDQALEFLCTSSTSNTNLYYQQSQKYTSTDSLFSGSHAYNPGTTKETDISLDYTHPANENVLFETGAKAVLKKINSQSNVSLLNPVSDEYAYNSSQSNSLSYDRTIYAGYISGTFKMKVFDVKTGVRYEYTDTKAEFSSVGNVNIKPYGTVVPSFIISHAFKNNNTLKLSYTYRIQRPDYRDLNPFVNSTDPRNLTTGNPDLRPEIANNIDLGYTKYFDKGPNINVVLFYHGSNYDIQSYTVYYPNYTIGDSTYKNVAVSTRQNIGLENNFGLNIFASVPVTSKIKLRSNISMFQRYIINTIDANQNISGFNYRINMNATYQLNSKLSLEFFGNFNSSRVNAQGRMPSFTTYNFAFRKQLFHDKCSIAVTATNPFNKYVDQKTTLNGTDFSLVSDRQLPYRSFGVNFTYKFGKLEFKKQKEAEDINLTNPPSGN